MQMSFGAMEMDARVRRDSALLKAHALIDWEGLRAELLGFCKREARQAEGQAHRSIDYVQSSAIGAVAQFIGPEA